VCIYYMYICVCVCVCACVYSYFMYIYIYIYLIYTWSDRLCSTYDAGVTVAAVGNMLFWIRARKANAYILCRYIFSFFSFFYIRTIKSRRVKNVRPENYPWSSRRVYTISSYDSPVRQHHSPIKKTKLAVKTRGTARARRTRPFQTILLPDPLKTRYSFPSPSARRDRQFITINGARLGLSQIQNIHAELVVLNRASPRSEVQVVLVIPFPIFIFSLSLSLSLSISLSLSHSIFLSFSR